MEQQLDRGFADAIAQVPRALQVETSVQATLQKMVEMEVATSAAANTPVRCRTHVIQAKGSTHIAARRRARAEGSHRRGGISRRFDLPPR